MNNSSLANGSNENNLNLNIKYNNNSGVGLMNNSSINIYQSNSEERSRRETFQTLGQPQLLNWNVVGTSVSEHLNNLRRTNLINVLSSKQSQKRSDRQNKLIMEMLRYQQFFQSISNNNKSLSQISSRIQYRFFGEGSLIYNINQFTQGYFILIRGSVQLSIPEKTIYNTKIKVETQNQKNLREIQENHKAKQNRKITKKRKVKKSQKKQECNHKQNQTDSIRNQLISIKQTSSPNNSPQFKPSQFSKQEGKIGNKLQKRLSRMGSVHLDSQNSNSCSKQKCRNYKLNGSRQKMSQNKANKANKTKQQQQTSWSPTQFNLQNSDYSGQDQVDLFISQFSNQVDLSVNQAQSQIRERQAQQHLQVYKDKIVKTVQQGQCFGEITVGQINKRATKAKARQDCHLILIRKQHYDLISKASLGSELKKRHQFLLSLQLFKKVYRYSVQEFLYYMNQVPLQYKAHLFKEGEQIKYVYIVKNGQFNLSKTISYNCLNRGNPYAKVNTPRTDALSELRRQQPIWRQGVLKAVFSGEIIGDAQIFMKKQLYGQTCKCTSQAGVVYRIDKRVFMQKLLAPQNQINSIKRYLNSKYKAKLKFIQIYLNRQLKNQTICRILPASRSCDRIFRKNLQLKRSGTSLNHTPNQKQPQGNNPNNYPQSNFFDDLNKTFHENKERRNISLRRAVNINEAKVQRGQTQAKRCRTSITDSSAIKKYIRSTNEMPCYNSNKKYLVQVPSCIKDIVQMVDCKQKYYKTRNKNSQVQTDFHFQTHKLPRFIQQKYKYLVSRIKAK